jgi:hypothetical protein
MLNQLYPLKAGRFSTLPTQCSFKFETPLAENAKYLKVNSCKFSLLEFDPHSASVGKMKSVLALACIIATVVAHCPNGCNKHGSCGLNGEFAVR